MSSLADSSRRSMPSGTECCVVDGELRVPLDSRDERLKQELARRCEALRAAWLRAHGDELDRAAERVASGTQGAELYLQIRFVSAMA